MSFLCLKLSSGIPSHSKAKVVAVAHRALLDLARYPGLISLPCSLGPSLAGSPAFPQMCQTCSCLGTGLCPCSLGLGYFPPVYGLPPFFLQVSSVLCIGEAFSDLSILNNSSSLPLSCCAIYFPPKNTALTWLWFSYLFIVSPPHQNLSSMGQAVYSALFSICSYLASSIVNIC